MNEESIRAGFEKLSIASQIQFCYPTEPDWALVEEAVLIELVRNYRMEQSCATSALYELSGRKHEALGDLCVFLLAEPDADKWLKRSALGLLPATHQDKGLDAALGFVAGRDTATREKQSPSASYPILKTMLMSGSFAIVAGIWLLVRNFHAFQPAPDQLIPDLMALALGGILLLLRWMLNWNSLLMFGLICLTGGSWALVQDVGKLGTGLLMVIFGVILLWFNHKIKGEYLLWQLAQENDKDYAASVSDSTGSTQSANNETSENSADNAPDPECVEISCADIHFSGSMTREEYIEAEQLVSSWVIPLWKILFLFGFINLIAGVAALKYQAGIPAAMMLLLAPVLMWLGWAIKGLFWDTNPEYRAQYSGTINDKGIDIRSGNSWHFTNWTEMTGWKASNTMLILMAPCGARVLPQSHFASRQEWEAA